MDENSREEIKNRINTKINGNLPMEGCNQNLVLITITIVGCAGQFKFLIKQDDLVLNVIKATLKSYARQGWLPKLSSNAEDFVLYCQTTAHSCLSPTKTIESCGGSGCIVFGGGEGNFRFVVKQDDLVLDVIKKTLKSYARQGRLPQLGSNAEDFDLCSRDPPYSCLSLTKTIESYGGSHFILKRNTNVGLKGDKLKSESFNWKSLFVKKGRLPQLGSNAEDFDLCSRDPPYSCLSPTKTIESYGGSHFILKRNTNVGLKGEKLKSESFNWKSLFVKKDPISVSECHWKIKGHRENVKLGQAVNKLPASLELLWAKSFGFS
ncbi:hypothetical protein K1719_024233 [Acacia pycnantha]|nr:hypothetical protein K1719_024233 [Acacia pycnantha]